MSKGPVVYVRKHNPKSGYWSRERVTEALKRARDTRDVRQKVPQHVLVGYLQQNFQKGKGANDREHCKENFRKIPDEAIRIASGQPAPDPEHRRPTDEEN